jgi:hypothetical protein
MDTPDDRSLEARASAAECLRLAAVATDAGSRAALLLMAQKWMEHADARSGALRSDALLPEPVTKIET